MRDPQFQHLSMGHNEFAEMGISISCQNKRYIRRTEAVFQSLNEFQTFNCSVVVL